MHRDAESHLFLNRQNITNSVFANFVATLFKQSQHTELFRLIGSPRTFDFNPKVSSLELHFHTSPGSLSQLFLCLEAAWAMPTVKLQKWQKNVPQHLFFVVVCLADECCENINTPAPHKAVVDNIWK